MGTTERPVFAEFLLGDLFECGKGDVDLQQRDINGKGELFINSGLENKGIKGRTDRPAKVFPAGTLTIDFWGNAFYRDEPYKLATHNHVFSLSGDVPRNEAAGLYIEASLAHLPQLFSYTNMATWPKLRELSNSLPVTPSTDLNYEYTPDDIDWAYMERCIAELEQERIAELDAYLKAAGLDDCALTAEDEAALAEQPVFAEFLLKDIAELGYGNKFDKNKMTHNNPCYNFVGRAEKNNGITDFVDDNGTEPYPAGSITLAFGGSIGSTFIQPKPYYTSQNVGVITLPDGVSENAKLYFTKALEKVCKNRYVAFADEINKHFKTDLAISLPVVPSTDPDHSYTPDDIDWAYMERYIRAIEKQVVVGVVEYKDKVIETTKQFIA